MIAPLIVAVCLGLTGWFLIISRNRAEEGRPIDIYSMPPRWRRLYFGATALVSVGNAALAVLTADDRLIHAITAIVFAALAVRLRTSAQNGRSSQAVS